MLNDDLSMVPTHVRRLAEDTAKELGPDWRTEAILSSALVVHPIGLRIMMEDHIGHIRLTVHVAVSINPRSPLETITADVLMTADHARTVGKTTDTIRTELLPHFGRADALAGLRVLSLPLRAANLPVEAQGSNCRLTMDYKSERFNSRATEHPYRDGEHRPFHVTITAKGDDSTRVEIRISHLDALHAGRIAAAAIPRVYAPVPVADHLPDQVRELAAVVPGLTAEHTISNVPRYTNLTDPSGAVTIRHAVAVSDTGARTWAAVWIRNASVATAYAALTAYTAH
ncbi:hypothetical protein [Streptomyces sp. NPDC001948]